MSKNGRSIRGLDAAAWRWIGEGVATAGGGSATAGVRSSMMKRCTIGDNGVDETVL